jgi:hypothetical protein
MFDLRRPSMRGSMNGSMLVMAPDRKPVETKLTAPPDLETLHKHVGGYIEVVPHFQSIVWPRGDTVRRRCVALCNEDGKRLRLAHNNLAELFWCASLAADFGMSSCRPDYLVGTVVILFGDAAFMESL